MQLTPEMLSGLDAYDVTWLRRTVAKTIVDANGCWVWQGKCTDWWGYGNTCHRSIKTRRAHRIVYQLVNKVTLGRWDFVCHRCDNPPCVNPAHLFVGTPQDNAKDCSAKQRLPQQQGDACVRGHPWTPENVRIDPRGRGTCKTCERRKNRIRTGWPEDLADLPGRVPLGYKRTYLLKDKP